MVFTTIDLKLEAAVRKLAGLEGGQIIGQRGEVSVCVASLDDQDVGVVPVPPFSQGRGVGSGWKKEGSPIVL
jgi:hypothetical protein